MYTLLSVYIYIYIYICVYVYIPPRPSTVHSVKKTDRTIRRSTYTFAAICLSVSVSSLFSALRLYDYTYNTPPMYHSERFIFSVITRVNLLNTHEGKKKEKKNKKKMEKKEKKYIMLHTRSRFVKYSELLETRYKILWSLRLLWDHGATSCIKSINAIRTQVNFILVGDPNWIH